MTQSLSKIPEWRNVDAATFRGEILPKAQPAVLKGLVADWPAVKAGRESPRTIGEYLKRCDRGAPAESIVGPPSIKGRFFYNEDMRGFNFTCRSEPFAVAIDRLLSHLDDENPPALYMGASPVLDKFPAFAKENKLALTNIDVKPHIWIGNAATVAAHYDVSDNIACIVAGRRRFTLFPPDQLANLYVGPLEFTPAGAPVSMVSLEEPDFTRYPRFKDALAVAQVAELEPGDALFIPYLWWHHVQSLEKFNVLVNYWWNDAKPWTGSPFGALVHGIFAIRDLPPERREHWRRMFDHYVFQTGENSAAHLLSEHRGVQGEMTPDVAANIRSFLQQVLSRP